MLFAYSLRWVVEVAVLLLLLLASASSSLMLAATRLLRSSASAATAAPAAKTAVSAAPSGAVSNRGDLSVVVDVVQGGGRDSGYLAGCHGGVHVVGLLDYVVVIGAQRHAGDLRLDLRGELAPPHARHCPGCTAL